MSSRPSSSSAISVDIAWLVESTAVPPVFGRSSTFGAIVSRSFVPPAAASAVLDSMVIVVRAASGDPRGLGDDMGTMIHDRRPKATILRCCSESGVVVVSTWFDDYDS